MDTPLPPQQTNTIPTSPAPAPYTPPPAPAPVPYVPPVAPSQAPVNTPPPSDSHTGMIVGIVIAVLVLVAALYFLFLKSGDVAMVSPSPSVTVEPTISESPTPTPTPAIVLKSYSDAQFGYAFQYPELWTLATGSFRETEGLQRLIQFTEVIPPNMTRTLSSFTVEQNYRTLEQTRLEQVGKTETTMDISGQTAYRFSDSVDPDIFVYIASPSLGIKLHVPNEEMMQILSTFTLN